MLTKALSKTFGATTFVIKRKKGGFANMYPKYYLYCAETGKFIANAKKMSGNKTSNYLISTQLEVFSKDSECYVGKLRSNFKKNKYLLYDNGGNVTKDKALDMDQVRSELGCYLYDGGSGQAAGTRDITVALPELEQDQSPIMMRQLKKEDSIISKLQEKDLEELIIFRNQKPYWSQEKRSYALNFSDRVKCSSVKNFQLNMRKGKPLYPDEPQEVFLEFGKINSSEFTLS